MIFLRQIINNINFSQPCTKWLFLLKALLFKSFQQRFSIYFVDNQLYINKEKIMGGYFTDVQKAAFIKSTQQILNELIPNYSKIMQPNHTTDVLEEDELIIEQKNLMSNTLK